VRHKGDLPRPPPRSPSPRIPRRPGGQPIRAQRYCPDQLSPELFPIIGVLPSFPGPATGPHIVIRRTPVVPLGQPHLNVPEKKNHPQGRPLQPRFPKEPHHRRAADDSLAAKKPQASNVIRLEIERVSHELRVATRSRVGMPRMLTC
jgi:hypothetical protein